MRLLKQGLQLKTFVAQDTAEHLGDHQAFIVFGSDSTVL